MTGGLLEPASLSHNIVTNLLRDELGYQHLVVTDDLEMGAIAKHCEIEAAVVRAFLAGEDMLLICARPGDYSPRLSRAAGRRACGQTSKGSHPRHAEANRRDESDR